MKPTALSAYSFNRYTKSMEQAGMDHVAALIEQVCFFSDSLGNNPVHTACNSR
jgi:hypothetical protein